MNSGYWLAIILFSAIGMGYFVYGKKQSHMPALIAGIALCIYPYLTSNVWMLWLIGLGLSALPFIWRE